MRLDKFLKVSRIIKRRTIAKEVADQSRVTINGQVAKSSSAVHEGDEISIRFGNRILTVKVNLLQDSTKKEDAVEMYTVLEENKIED
ncbi:RNA-binding S4 domain-containing protein [Facklamia sp. DSM 111018]|uniref:RQC P-site tRNA stabilizing factor n=1 Tax=Facklamia lactis TaxID=2749967 RepID=A0ABS0LQQ9_9LACT|nr:RNA-binding S4 domain-containing protein [Facklamia lactis]MBG9980675.1 RNA-binding S4 domain-containing protein [Facklamia lactis]MBG9986489.1 RNA-binding S4 domain-containing protein [Facklamia lactis]